LDGVAYWVLEDHDAIYQFVDKQLRKEWEEDLRSEGRDPKQSGWLQSLLRCHWELKVLELRSVKLNSELMSYVDAKRDYNFREHLSKRAAELRSSIERFGTVIWPIVIRTEDSQLMDGYCRYHALSDMGISRTFAYSGKLQ
jgi:hypothetical protein